MANICLPPAAVEKFRKAFTHGDIDPDKLANMSSSERHDFFKKLSDDESATTINSLFESKLLLKNQQDGFVTWAKSVANVSPAARRDLVAKVSKLDRVLDPQEKENFLADLAKTKLGVGVTQEEAKNIAQLSKNIDTAVTKRNSDLTFKNDSDAMDYGRAVHDLHKYVGDLKNDSDKLRLGDLKGTGTIKSVPRLIRAAGDLSKSVGASLDDSFAFRQGAKTLFTHPAIWQKEFRNSFVNLAKGFKNAEEASREFHARIIADPLYDKALRSGLAVKGAEDVFPTSLPEKIPVFGRAFGASEVAYTAFAENLRMALFKQSLEKAGKMGENINDVAFTKNVAKFVNSLTGRGGFGAGEQAIGKVNFAFYSLRFMKANVDTLLLHPLGVGVGGVGSYAQKEAAKSLAKIVVATAGILGIANALKPGSVEFDPRSSDFGKIKVGDTRFDVSGGMGSIITLAARLASQSSKSSTTHQVTKLNSGKYGSQTEWDVFTNYFANKLSPVGGVVRDKLKGQDPAGNAFSLKSEAGKLVTPLGISNFNELRSDPNSANTLAAMILDGLGISTNSYQASSGSSSFANKTGKEVTAFKSQIGAEQFKQAAKSYDQKLNAWQTNIVNNPDYNKLSTEDQKTVVTKEKAKLQAETFNKYNFKYKRSAPQADKFKSLL